VKELDWSVVDLARKAEPLRLTTLYLASAGFHEQCAPAPLAPYRKHKHTDEEQRSGETEQCHA
jgi:hypothetical protein